MIKSFKNKETEKLFGGDVVKSAFLPRELYRKALIKLSLINASSCLEDLRIPPGNKLKKLEGSRKDEYSIRINDQYRICFEWQGSDAHEVEIVDYH